jgi:hypothetical protein
MRLLHCLKELDASITEAEFVLRTLWYLSCVSSRVRKWRPAAPTHHCNVLCKFMHCKFVMHECLRYDYC